MIQLEYTCIKKGNYTVAIEPTENPTPVNPEIDSDEPDFDGYPQEIDYPDYGEEYFDETREIQWDTELRTLTNIDSEHNFVDSEIDSNDFEFEVIVAETRKDITEGKFLDKFVYYMDLLRVSRYELDSFLDYEFDFNNPENFEIKVKDAQVFDRLFALYCPDDSFVIPAQTNHHLRQYLDRLEPDGRYFPKKQLNIFGS